MNGLILTGLERHRRAPGPVFNVFQTTGTPNPREKSSVIECDKLGAVKSFTGADKCERLQLRRRSDSCSKAVNMDI